MTTPDCPHEWGRFLSDPFTRRCVVCGLPFPGETPVRSFSDLDIVMHDEPEHSDAWEAFGATPGSAEIAAAKREAA